jgi:hypothetical protein
LATLIVCPRCRGAVQPDARACPRCGLVLTGLASHDTPPGLAIPDASEGYDARPTVDASAVDYSPNGMSGAPTMASTTPYGQGSSLASPPLSGQPVRGASVDSVTAAGSTVAATAVASEPAQVAARVVPKGAIELLPEESVVFQLGALYLTNKRVILLAPSVVRAAFLRDVDAVGTLTERSSGWSLFFGLVFLGLAAAGIYLSIARAQFEDNLPLLYIINPLFIGIALAVFGLILLVMYFIWVKRTLFISVSGRPLITVSVADWNSRKLEGMDGFVNAFFQVKDMIR